MNRPNSRLQTNIRENPPPSARLRPCRYGLWLLVFWCLPSVTYAQPPTVVRLADYGIKPNSFANAAPAIQKALAACAGRQNATLVLPGGRIDVWPDGSFKRELYISNSTENDTLSKVKNVAFLLDGFRRFTLEGNNTLVVLHGKMISYALIRSEEITVKNVQFDYERPTMSELTIAAISDTSADVVIHPDSRYVIENGRIGFYGEGWKSNAYHAIVFDSVANTMNYSSFKNFNNVVAKPTGPNRVHFSGNFSKRNFQSGHTLTIRDPYRDNCGAFIWLSKNVLIENVRMYYMHGLGNVSQFSENIRFRNVHVKPRENSGRVVSAFADCFHFSGCRGLVSLDSCVTSGAHDDPVNVHGTHLKITTLSANGRLTVRFMHHQTYGFAAFFGGDSIAFINPQTLQPVAYARLKTARLVNKREMELQLDGPLPKAVATGLCVENLTWTPSLSVTNCRFERTNTRGMLVTTRRNVLIANNTFVKTGMHAILIADDAASWFESGPVQDVTIRNNVFEECGYVSAPNGYVINIAPENHRLIPGFYVHRNIRIENNTFRVGDVPLLSAKSVDGLVFRGNTITPGRQATTLSTKKAFHLTASRNVVIQNNTFQTGWKPQIEQTQMPAQSLQTDLTN